MRVGEVGDGIGGACKPKGRLSEIRNSPLWGIGCLVAGIGIFSLQDLIIKLISGDYALHEVMTVRSLVATPILLALVAYSAGGLRAIATERAPILIVRSVLMFSAYMSYYLGLAALPLATCVALYFASPLFITVLSVCFLGERVGPRRWAAVIVGFLGVLVMLRPGSELFEWAALLPVYAGLAYAVAQILARKLGETESAAVMATYANFVFMGVALVLSAIFGTGAFADEGHPSLAFLVRGWSTPGTVDLLLMLACGVIAAAGLTFLTEAYRAAQANAVAPFEYTALIWGVLFGWIFLQEVPDMVGWLGMAIIVVAGLYILRREGSDRLS